MAKKLFVKAKTEAGLNAAVAEGTLNAEVAFLEEQGNEGIHAKGKTYQTIPSNGKDGQVLMSSNGKGVWANLEVLDLLSYGVEWNPNVSDPTLTRIGNMTYHKTLPIQSGMKGCIVAPFLHKVVYWLDEQDWRFRKEKKVFSYNSSDINVYINGSKPAEALTLLEGTNLTLEERYPYRVKLDDSLFKLGNNLKISGSPAIVLRASHSKAPGDEYGRYLELKVEDPSVLEGITSGVINIELGSNLAGGDGEVMVYVPEFYIKSWDEPDRKAVRISPTKIDDTWEYQPALFIGAYKDTILNNTLPDIVGLNFYIQSFFDTNPALSVANNITYCRGGSNNASTDAYEDIFRKELGKCRTSISRPSFRTYARQAGKEIMTYRQYKNIMYWLWVIEYATFNSQADFNPELTSEGFHQGGLGKGLTTMRNWSSYNSYSPIVPNGYTNELGNGTGVKELVIPKFTYELGSNHTIVTEQAQTLESVRWRGIEDPFGHVWTCVDGVVIDANVDAHPDNMIYVYTTTDPGCFVDDGSYINSMHLTGKEAPFSGWIKEWDLGSTAEIIPRLIGGEGPTLFKCDYHEDGVRDSVLRALLFGGEASSKNDGGLGYFFSDYGTEDLGYNVGYRTVYKPYSFNNQI